MLAAARTPWRFKSLPCSSRKRLWKHREQPLAQVEVAVRLAKEAFAAAQQAYKDFEEQPLQSAEPTLDMELDDDELPSLSAEELAAAMEEHARLEEEVREATAAAKQKGAHLALLTAKAKRARTERSLDPGSHGDAAAFRAEVGVAAEPSLACNGTAELADGAAASAAAAVALEAQAAEFTEVLRAKKSTAQRVVLDPGKYGAAPY